MLTQEQLDERNGYIGGSDVAVICGLSPFKNRIRLWQEKTGQVMPDDISENPHVKAGNFLEPSIIAWFESATGFTVSEDKKTYYHKDYDFIAAHFDGWVHNFEGRYILEVKTASNDKGWGAQGSSEIPNHYYLQVAHYMAVADVDVAYVAVLIRGVDFRYYRLERDKKLEEILIRTEVGFWEHVKNNEPPKAISADEFISLHGCSSIEESVLADEEIQSCIERLEQVNFQMSVLSEEKIKLSDKIKFFMGKKDTLVDKSGKIAATWRANSPTVRFDSQKFKKEKPDDYSKYIRVYTDSRRFLFKNNQELKND